MTFKQLLSYKNYLFSIVFLCLTCFTTAQNHINFKPIAPVVNNKPIFVSKTVQDKFGQIWMVHRGGLLIHDGYNFRPITNKNIFKTENERISDIVVCEKKDIWIISNTGSLLYFDINSGRFKNKNSIVNNKRIKTIFNNNNILWFATYKGEIFRHEGNSTDSITQITNNSSIVKDIKSLALTTPNNLFIGTEKGKIFNYNLNTKNCKEIVGLFTDYPGNIILTSDKNNRLWIGTETYGIFVYDSDKEKFIHDDLFYSENYGVNKQMFLTLYNDSDGYVWGGTDGGGLYKMDPETGKIELFFKEDSNEFSLGSNTILDINEDSHKNLWICTNYGKISVLPNVDNNIRYHEGSANHTPQRILSIYKSSKDILWIGTDGSGLTKVSFLPSGVSKEKQYFNNVAINRGFYIQSITEDKNQNIWFGTYRNGLWFHNTKLNTFEKINIVNPRNQEASDIRTVFTDSKGRIWAGTNISVVVFDANKKLLATFENNRHGLKGVIAESFVEDDTENIWLSFFNGGLFKFHEDHTNLQSSSFSDIPFLTTNDSKEKTSEVKSIELGENGTLWLIDNLSNLIKFDTNSKTFKIYDNIQPFKDVSLASIIKQDNDNLWLSSNNGIFHLNLKSNNIRSYYSTDGLQGNTFLTRCVFKDKDGTLYFGGLNGLNYFNPTKIRKKESTPKLYINTIEILNQPIDQLIPEQSNLNVYNMENLDLKSDQSSFSFKFSAIDNVLDPKFHYSYRLKGFNNKWVNSGVERIATYTNIPHGKYVFEVKAGTKSENWNIPMKQITVNIAPPFWQSSIAYILYFLLYGLFIYALRLWYKLRNKLLIEKINHKKENELHDLKMNFFAKMSHEIQTPITLILGPLEDMIKRSADNGNLLLNQRLKIIENNSKRLSKIARELTLIRNKELNELKLLVNKNNLYKHIDEISLSFKELARKKRIDFAINCPKNLHTAWYDKEKIEHVIYNLLSNAFKFTPKEGNVQLSVIPIDSKKQIKLSVSDTGSGIPKEELELIFDLFYQSRTNKKNKGSGIGLALTKELVDLHKGTIEVESSPVQGTVFTFTLPITKDAYNESELIITDNDNEELNEQEETEHENQLQKSAKDLSKKTILIVEDNLDLQAFLKELLVQEYNILLAENGAEGYHYAKSNFPDLILSDIMMPKMDGIEMCMMLQEDPLTKHIPVVMLTAKNSTNAKISGLKSGAIEYINKPFNTNELLLKIKNIISSKEHIISKYRKEIITSPDIDTEKTQDEIFLENMTNIINAKLNDEGFKIEDLAESLNMSYSSLYRKCQALTGKSLVDYIRLIRLKRAAILITKYGYTISESAFAVGFNDPKYFSKCFKKQYEKSPKEFAKEAEKIGVDNYLKKHNLEHFSSSVN
ncbi:hybrid sensor histidine kinase/response regulator transcription factor [Aestuariibaculum sediminum]|uniref:histidine kinase n=2 Tax=Bacteria TaxID=2 RepID=A0A8J6Q1U5_9FLAO|nr:ATP-binding protein [Aestuariibaculum sediminum]MBD0833242.1 response regulator [Aestuariibaculum sediminum]